MKNIIYKDNSGEIKSYGLSDLHIDTEDKKFQTFQNFKQHELYASLHKALDKGIVPILYDPNISSINKRVKEIDFPSINSDICAIFFTSGTSGEPTGVLKSTNNIFKELKTLVSLFHSYNFERIIVTVPLIHIYGFLTGVLLPNELKAQVVLKEEFLPHELLELAEDKKTLCVTNPVFLNALTKLNNQSHKDNITFLSSTARLEDKTIHLINKKFNSNIIQLFGSSETGGIGYKLNIQEYWTPLKDVNIDVNCCTLSVESPYVSKQIYTKEIKTLKQPFITTDLVEIKKNRFKLLGRVSEIAKISGKRVSLVEIENLLEENNHIDETIIVLKFHNNSHKSEQLLVLIKSELDIKELNFIVKDILQNSFKNINIKIEIKKVDEIKKNHLGKKIRINNLN